MPASRSEAARLPCPSWVLWALPMAACLLVFHRGLQTWFLQDDFACLRWQVHSLGDIARLFTEPKAQGTIRPFIQIVSVLAKATRVSSRWRPAAFLNLGR